MKYIIVLFIFFLLLSCSDSKKEISIGDQAPDFSLQDAEGNPHSLSSYQSKMPVIVYFYPKANTPGCTTEACGIRDDRDKFEENGIAVLGISVDSKDDIKQFVSDHHLNFPLLSDESKEVARMYGVLNESGKANRVTFIIDKEGKIAEIINDVDVTNHSAQVLGLAKKLI